jgi:aerobic carbon-monoxide dehydrogenase medium subunit
VKPAAFAYRAPASVEEALALLEGNPDAKLLAGGQSLVPVLNFRLASPPLLVDLNRIGSLAGIREEADGTLVIGAMTRHRAIEKSALVRRANPLLSAAMPFIAHAQIRNRGTMGGSLAHADPAAELPAVCLACDAELVIQSERGMRRVAAKDFFVGFFTTALEPAEVLVSIRFPAWPAHRRPGFAELSRRHGDFALVGVALTVDVKEGRCERARIALFGAEDAPRLVNADVPLHARAIAAAASPRADHHASAAYRRELIEVLTRRALEQAIAA